MLSTTTYENAQAIQTTENVTFAPGTTLADVEKAVILATLRHQRFNRTRAARVLGIGIRTLQRKLKQYRVESNVSVLS